MQGGVGGVLERIYDERVYDERIRRRRQWRECQIGHCRYLKERKGGIRGLKGILESVLESVFEGLLAGMLVGVFEDVFVGVSATSVTYSQRHCSSVLRSVGRKLTPRKIDLEIHWM